MKDPLNLEEGDDCPTGCGGKLEVHHLNGDDCCACHISPPCSYCTDTNFMCSVCGQEFGDPP